MSATIDPLIVCGMPRSGVRLLAALLDGHAEFASGPELPIVLSMGHQWRDIDRTLGVNHERHYELSRASTRASFRASVLALLAPRLAAARKRRFVLQSFGMAVSLDVFAELLPQSQFILLVRDPRDVCRSLLRCAWVNPRDGLPLPYTRSVAAGAHFWNDFTSLSLSAVASLGARAMVLRYEDLCTAPRLAMQQIAKFAEVPVDLPAVSSGAAHLVTLQIDQPHPPLRCGQIDSCSVGRWRTELRPDDVATVEAATIALRSRLGYAEVQS